MTSLQRICWPLAALFAAVVCAGPAMATILFDDQFNVDGTIDASKWRAVGLAVGGGPPPAIQVSNGELIMDTGVLGSAEAESITTFQVPAAGSGLLHQLDTKYRDFTGNGVGHFSIRFIEELFIGGNEMNLTFLHQNTSGNSPFGDYWLRVFGVSPGHTSGVSDFVLPLAGGSTDAMEWVRVTVQNIAGGEADVNLLTSPDGTNYSNIQSVTVGEFTNDVNVTITGDSGFPGSNETEIALDFVTVQTAVPEPASATLVALGAVALVAVRRRRRRD